MKRWLRGKWEMVETWFLGGKGEEEEAQILVFHARFTSKVDKYAYENPEIQVWQLTTLTGHFDRPSEHRESLR